MSSIQGEIECPNCKGEHCIEDFNQVNQENLKACGDCGYYYHKHIMRDEDGTPILDEEKQLQYCEHEVKEPYAAISIQGFKGVAQGVAIDEQEHFDDFVANFRDHVEIDMVESITYSRVEDGKLLRGTIYKASKRPDGPVKGYNLMDYPMGKGGDA